MDFNASLSHVELGGSVHMKATSTIMTLSIKTKMEATYQSLAAECLFLQIYNQELCHQYTFTPSSAGSVIQQQPALPDIT